MSPATGDAMAYAEAFARAILDARREAQAHMWAPWIAQAQREAAPLVRAVRVLALRASCSAENGPATATNGPAETRPGLSTDNSNSRESAKRGPRIGRGFAPGDSPRSDAGQVRGVVAERVILSAPLDPFMDLNALAEYSQLSRRTLRKFLDLAPDEALPCFRLPGKVLVRRSDFDRWIQAYQARGRPSLTRALRELGLDPSVRTGVSSR